MKELFPEPDKDPICDDDGYPSEQELERIRDWPLRHDHWGEDLTALMDYVAARWSYPQFWTKAKRLDVDWKGARYSPADRERALKRKYWVSTGGWSGNESLIGALRQHEFFWMICWYSERVGGQFEFRVPEKL